MKSMTPAFRVSIGLVFMIVSVLLFADLLGMIPDTSKVELQNRKKLIESIAIQVSYNEKNNDLQSMANHVHTLQKIHDDVQSIAIRKADGSLLINAGNHEEFWSLPKDSKSTISQIKIPLHRSGFLWGTIEITFLPDKNNQLYGITIPPILRIILFVAVLGFFIFFMFMKKILQHLDPSSVIPDRVKLALDTLTEGLVLMDENERIVLANMAFSKKTGMNSDTLLGKKVSGLNWHTKRKTDMTLVYPWQVTLNNTSIVTGTHLKLNTPEGLRTLSINSTPILDAKREQRGALATFDDVSDIEEKNFQLKRTMHDLKKSQSEIEKTNEKLRLLATTDSLTGCLNRRAFFEIFEEIFKNSGEQELCCIMADIDHFKSVNDDFGHGAGDAVIQKMAQALTASVREGDYVCRYGGEEFCILMPGISLREATQIAERIRKNITSTIKNEVYVIPGRVVTSSLGVSSSLLGASDPAFLVNQADLALYNSKENGRNQVTRFDDLETATETD
ncbi:MAG: diguanylate cyclase [Gammaproteobacteria bacterium]